MTSHSRHALEPLEARIAPAITITNSIFDITAGIGKTSATIDLGTLVDASKSYRSVVELATNFTAPGEGTPGVIKLELFDDTAPLTVQNFLAYVNSPDFLKDFDGTIFNRLVSGFVLQGGGKNASDLTGSLATFPPVHNEFDANDPARSNTAFTVAMAKVSSDQGGGPNSASREFFINLANNAANLDFQNGGFTVFGKVATESQSLVTALGNLNVYAGSVPVQNYTGNSEPTLSQLIQIVDARVVAPGTGDATGYSFAVESILDATSGLPSNLLKAVVTGAGATEQLDLKFASGKTGEVLVKIKISKDGEADVFDEFKVTVNPNLITEVNAAGLPTAFTPGDKGVAEVKITNNAGGVAKGKVDVKLYLSEYTAADPSGFTFEPATDFLLSTLSGVSINVASGKSTSIPVKYNVPANALGTVNQYRFLAVVETSSGSTIHELFSDDNTGNAKGFDDVFGTLGGEKNVPITFSDADDHVATLTIKGPGFGSITRNSDGSIDVDVSGTTASSTLTLTTPKGGAPVHLHNLSITDTIGSVKLGQANIDGFVTLGGGAKQVTLGDLGNTAAPSLGDKTFTIGTFPTASQKTTISLGKVRDYSLESFMPVASLSASDWLNEVGLDNSILATSLGKLQISNGDFEADLTVTGNSAVSLLSVSGAIEDATVKIGGNIGTVKVGGLTDSNFFAGVSAKPILVSDFTSRLTISSFQVLGTMANSVVAAATFNSIKVATIDQAQGTPSWGFYADVVKSYLRSGIKLSNLNTAAHPDDLPNYELQIL